MKNMYELHQQTTTTEHKSIKSNTHIDALNVNKGISQVRRHTKNDIVHTLYKKHDNNCKLILLFLEDI